MDRRGAHMAFPTRVWLIKSRLGGDGAWGDGMEGTSTNFFVETHLGLVWAWNMEGKNIAFLSNLIIDQKKLRERVRPRKPNNAKMRWPVSPCCPPPPKTAASRPCGSL